MKQTAIAVGVVTLAALILGAFIYFRGDTEKTPLAVCPADVMACPDGSTVPRSGPNCEFGICKQVQSPKMIEGVSENKSQQLSTTSRAEPVPIQKITPKSTQPKREVPTTFFEKVQTAAVALVNQITTTVQNTVVLPDNSNANTQNQTATQSNNSQQTPPAINETRYNVSNNSIVDNNNQVIYTIPSFSNTSGTSLENNHIVNVVPVNNIAPVVGAIPVNGTTGKYYVSENSFGAPGSCQFSNRIYILDTVTNTKVLMYEENSSLLQEDDPRSCNSEMYLLATENEKLVLKYHTVGTNMICESTWSEPEKTWYLDVTKPENKTRRYVISDILYTQAENEETSCRLNLETSTSTPE